MKISHHFNKNFLVKSFVRLKCNVYLFKENLYIQIYEIEVINFIQTSVFQAIRLAFLGIENTIHLLYFFPCHYRTSYNYKLTKVNFIRNYNNFLKLLWSRQNSIKYPLTHKKHTRHSFIHKIQILTRKHHKS